MLHTDKRFAKAVEAAVETLEKRTDAEVVVVAAERSGHYKDVARIWASVAAFAALVTLLFIPWTVHPVMVVVEVGITWALAAWVLNGRSFLRLLVSKRRKGEQVDAAAAAEFHREVVHGTPNRTGLLIYVSALEGKVEILPDVGIQARIPGGKWASAREAFCHEDLDHFLTGLLAVGDLLEAHVPHVEGSDDTDLPNAPRIRE